MSSYRAVNGRGTGNASNGQWKDERLAYNYPRSDFGILHIVSTNGLSTNRLGDITDGTSNTLMVGEYHTITRPRRGTFWAYSYTSYSNSAVCWNCSNRTLLSDYDKCLSIGGIGGANACKRGWGSLHVGILDYLMGDGAVRGISENINIELLGDLATKSGGEIIGQF